MYKNLQIHLMNTLQSSFALASIPAAITTFLSFDGLRSELGGDPISDIKCMLMAIGIGVVYMSCLNWVLKVMIFTPTKASLRQVPFIMAAVVFILGASSSTNFNSLAGEGLIQANREGHVVQLDRWVNQNQQLARRVEGLEAVVENVAATVNGLAQREADDAEISKRSEADESIVRTLSALAKRTQATAAVLEDSARDVDEYVQQISEAKSEMRRALLISDKQRQRLYFSSADDRVKNAAIAMRETLPIQVFRGIAAELANSSMLGTPRDYEEERGFKMAYSILAQQSAQLSAALDRVEGDSALPPILVERSSFALALSIGPSTYPQFVVAAVGIDLLPFLLAWSASIFINHVQQQQKEAQLRHVGPSGGGASVRGSEEEELIDDGWDTPPHHSGRRAHARRWGSRTPGIDEEDAA